MLNMYNPEKVIIHGGILRAREIIEYPLIDSAKKHTLQNNFLETEIIFSELGENIDILGAGTLWIHELLNGRIPNDYEGVTK